MWDGALSHLHGVQTRIDPAKNWRCYYNRATKQVCSFGREGGSDLAEMVTVAVKCMGGKATVVVLSHLYYEGDAAPDIL